MIRFFQFVVLVLGLLLVALGSAIVTMRFAIHGAELTVPNFRGMTVQDALSKASSLGVEMSIDNRLYSSDVPAGRILIQSPAAGSVVRREWHLRATESLGPQMVAIPNLLGQPERTATIQARRLGLQLETVARLPSPGATPDTVIAQNPAAGAAGVEKPRIGVIVADPAPPTVAAFLMPDLTGQPFATASATISHAGLKLAPVSTTANPSAAQANVTAGTVVAQSPQAGYKVGTNTSVELTVAQ